MPKGISSYLSTQDRATSLSELSSSRHHAVMINDEWLVRTGCCKEVWTFVCCDNVFDPKLELPTLVAFSDDQQTSETQHNQNFIINRICLGLLNQPCACTIFMQNTLNSSNNQWPPPER
ncbi:Thymus-Specific Serine Protease [Manis pentadactyla]|nr:Thymus-Specific Serine Protease [Manis pentadactyla]